MTTPGPGFIADYLEDHALLLAALETPAFWSSLLSDELAGSEVADVYVEAVGTGQVASCLRIRLAHDAPTAPRSVVAKTGSEDPNSRMMSAALRHGEIEVGFYSHLAGDALLRTPACHVAAINPAADDFLLVLEDLDEYTQGDQIHGMSPEDSGAAIDQLAALHAAWWCRTPAGAESILGEQGDPAAHSALLSMLYPGFTERYADRLEPEVMEMSVALMNNAVAYLGDRPGPSALVHRDFRPDNLLVGPEEVAVVDWQTVSLGPALSDLSYFLGGALVADDRVDHETELLQRYRSGLATHGVELGMATIESGYRRYALDGLVMAIGASQVVGQTDRGDEMFCAMAERSAQHALESGTLDMLT